MLRLDGGHRVVVEGLAAGGILERLLHHQGHARGVVVTDQPGPVLGGVVDRAAGDGTALGRRVPRCQLSARVPPGTEQSTRQREAGNRKKIIWVPRTRRTSHTR